MSSPNQIHFEEVWENKSETLIEEIVYTWQKAAALPKNEDPLVRAQQVVLVVRNAVNEIIGITTAKRMHYLPLKNELYFFRGLLLPEYRIPGLFIKMTKTTLQKLEFFTKNSVEVRKPIGVITEIENPRLKEAKLTQMVSGMILLGFSKQENPVYVYYFKGSRY